MNTRLTGLAGLKILRAELKREATESERRRHEEALARQRAERDRTEFKAAMEGVAPIRSDGRIQLPTVLPAPIALQRQIDEQAALCESLSDEFDAESLLETDDKLSWRRNGIGLDVVRKLRRGHWVVSAELDLHGLRREQAREQLGQFIRDCIKRGDRCVRVIHGKGLGSVAKQPVLKAKVFNWLIQKEQVLALCQARAQDGGTGALMVLLRTPRAP